jgi:PHP family Zn ribbon phosphoesterase
MPILADLHNHSCLSPCGSLELSPRVLAEGAAARGIELLALTDHNTALNGPAFAAACRRRNIMPVFGMEACTREEVHVLCLFGALPAALDFGDHLYGLLPDVRNIPERLGDQVYVDEEDGIEGVVDRYLGSALDLGLDEIGGLVQEWGGLAIPAHVDRAAFSMTSQLGFVVDGPWAALECVRLPPVVDTRGYPLTTSSDAHYPEHVGRRPFELATVREELQPDGPEGGLDLRALAAALARRPRS